MNSAAHTPAPARPELVSFDLDGTLIDTAGEIVQACNLTLVEAGLPPRPAQAVVHSIGHGLRHLMDEQLAQALQQAPAPVPGVDGAQLHARLLHHYRQTCASSAQAYPGAVQAVHMLAEAGIVCVCVTNKDHDLAMRLLERAGLDRLFAQVIGGDSLPFRKPDPRVLWHVLQPHGVAPARAAHVGDSRVDIDTARAAGVAAWAVSYGYNGGQPVQRHAPDALFDRLDDMARRVLGKP